MTKYELKLSGKNYLSQIKIHDKILYRNYLPQIDIIINFFYYEYKIHTIIFIFNKSIFLKYDIQIDANYFSFIPS